MLFLYGIHDEGNTGAQYNFCNEEEALSTASLSQLDSDEKLPARELRESVDELSIDIDIDIEILLLLI